MAKTTKNADGTRTETEVVNGVTCTTTYAKQPVKSKPMTTIMDLGRPQSEVQKVRLPSKKQAEADREETHRTEAPKVLRPPDEDPVYRALLGANFLFARGEQDGDSVVYGYVHKDGRAVLHVYGSAWQLRMPNGNELGGRDVKTLRTALKKSRLQTAEAKKIARKVEREAQAHTEHEAVISAAPPAEVVSVLRIVAEATEDSFTLRRLQGDEQYKTRLRIAKRILGESEARAKDAEWGALVKRLYVMLGVKDAVAFVSKAKETMTAAKQAERAKNAEWSMAKKKGLAATKLERVVPGSIKPGPPRKQTKEEEAEERQQLKAELEARKKTEKAPEKTPNAPAQVEAATPLTDLRNGSFEKATGYAPGAAAGRLAELKDGQAQKPREDAQTELLVPSDCALLEHTVTGVVMLRLARPGVHGGAPCIYNNGRDVSLGIVSLETLAKFSVIENADVQAAAKQLLTPIVASVKVDPVAARHLTAVMNCKEIATMAEATAAAPAKKAAKKAAAKKTPAKKTAAPKGERAPRANGYAGKKIKVVNKDHGAREGTKRAKGMDIILKSKTTDEAIPALSKIGCDNSFLAFAVNSGYIELV